jgi:exonuclease III
MNVRGLFSSVKKRNDVFDWAKGKNTSIVCFQETHSSKEVEKPTISYITIKILQYTFIQTHTFIR